MTLSESAIRELCTICTRDESGAHFTEFASHYRELEAAGMIAIHRPVHDTGLAYDPSYWMLEVTPEGIEAVEANPELHPEA